MKYVILIHSNPDPWGHPTVRLHRGGPGGAAGGARRGWTREFDALLEEIWAPRASCVTARGPRRPDVVHASTAGARTATSPPTARTPRPRSSWPGSSSSTRETRERAEEIAAQFARTRRHRRAAARDVARWPRTVTARPRARLARRGAARARGAGASVRRLRRRRGRRPGGPARRGHPVAGRRVSRDNPRAWLIRSPRAGWSTSGARSRPGPPARSGCVPRGRRAERRRPGARRLARAAAPVLPPVADPALAGGADAAGGRRAQHGPDRARRSSCRRRRWPSGSAARRPGCARRTRPFAVPAARRAAGPGRRRARRCSTSSSPRDTRPRPAAA